MKLIQDSKVNEFGMHFIYLAIILLVSNIAIALLLKLIPINIIPEIKKYIFVAITLVITYLWFQYTFL